VLARSVVVLLLLVTTGLSATQPIRQDVPPPAGAAMDGVRWLRLTNGDSVQIAAVRGPPGDGPYPTVVYLHGIGGLYADDVAWTRYLADAGYVVVAGCWLPVAADLNAGGVPCPDDSADRRASVDTLIDLARSLPTADANALALVGISAGGFQTFDVLARRHDIQAAVIDSGGTHASVDAISTPILMLGGEADPTVPITLQRSTEQALRMAGKDVSSEFYLGTGHMVLEDPVSSEAATARAIVFLDSHLRM
jgi:dienelactone hydrolase